MDFQAFFALGMKRSLGAILDTLDTPSSLQINLGPGASKIYGTIGYDWPEWDADRDPTLPHADGSVGIVHAYHFLEHLHDPLPVLREVQRVLAPGGLFNIVVPYYSANIAAMDLDHKTWWTEDTWKTLLHNTGYAKNHTGWRFRIQFNLIAGIVERNLCLFTQLVREPD